MQVFNGLHVLFAEPTVHVRAQKETQRTYPNQETRSLASSSFHPPPDSWGKQRCFLHTSPASGTSTFATYANLYVNFFSSQLLFHLY